MLVLPLSAFTAELEESDLEIRIKATQDIDQLYALAIKALADERPELAIEALERVIAARPRFAGAWLDLALASYRSGDPVAALEHLEYLRSQFSLPLALAAQVDYWHRLWQSPQQAPAQLGWQGEVILGLGYDTNANAGLDSRQMPLSLPGGSAMFEVDKKFQPRADVFSLFGLTTWGPPRAVAAGRLNPILLLRSKQLFHEGEYSTLDLRPGLLYEQATGEAGSWQLSVFAQHYRLGGDGLFNGLRIATQRNQTWRSCLWAAGVEIEARQHQRVTNLGGTIFGLNGSLGCRVLNNGNLSATLRTGYEQAHGDRPGGDNRGSEIFVLYDQPIDATRRVQASWQYTVINDQEGYSPLLENNAARSQRRQLIAISLRQALGREWELRLNFERLEQNANLSLFEQSGVVTMLGLARRFE